MATKKQDASIDILEVQHKTILFRILGKTPIIHNSLSQKTQQQLLLPPQKKNAAQKASTLKHEPYQEFRDAPYTTSDPDAETHIQVLSSAFKGALKSAALDIPGSSKAQIGRLTWVEGERISIYGQPELFMSVTRSADIARTPDVRTRCIMREWACEVAVTFIFPTLKQNSIANLMAAAGLMSGIGDWRPGKGAGSYGQFEIVAEDDVRWNRIVNDYGRDVQLEAMANPVPYDDETQKLLGWFDGEAKARGFEVVA